MKTFVIVPVFKRLKLTKIFVNSLVENWLGDITILIVDDSDELENYNYFKHYDSDNVITIHTKIGDDSFWCGTMRVGIDYLNENLKPNPDDIVIFANNDVTIDEAFFHTFYHHIDSESIVHPQTLANNKLVSSGCKVKSWFPYITSHPICETSGPHNPTKVEIDLCTARFLSMKFSTLKVIGNIAGNLIQYHGDNDFSLRAKKLGIRSYIINGAVCKLYDDDTGKKNSNINRFKDAYNSLFEIRSANNLYSRWCFINNHFSKIHSVFILLSMTVNVFVKVIMNKFK